ncbi:amino acid adenylation domain-containing protein [Streptomyces sp. HNM1019]|uniref:amino acid adenylation domain-containing protein n=1 Tax=Streptomyces sp. HNM1019 TaxID=3424717 RepID=UPI003D77F12F
MVDLFAEVAEQAPDRMAVEGGGIRMTVGDIDRASARIAAELAAAGVGNGDAVAVVVDRSAYLPAALLGVMRSGAAFVPVDPDYPAQRRALMLQDARARATVTLSQFLAQVDHTRPVILLDTPPTDASHTPDGPRTSDDTSRAFRAVLPAVRPADLAYAMYTSGSTGRPKGVEISHQAFAKGVLVMASVVNPQPDDVWLSVTSPSFDPSLLDLFLPLLTQGRIVIAGNERVVAGDALHALLVGSRATVMQATPLTWRMLLADGWAGRLRLALCAGEVMHPTLARALGERCGEVWNAYGPTETTIYATAHRVGPVDAGSIPVGPPLPDTDVRILGEDVAPVARGEIGELWIGGTGVGAGYRGREDLTADRFRTLPGDRSAGRFYRTGDLGRQLADGTIELFGRADDQVKIRGHRIEPGEVENQLLAHPGVESAVVVPRSLPGAAGLQLVAYVRPAHGGEISARGLLDFLAERLPKYMVPSAVVEVAQWPRTATYKIDRNRLPDPGTAPGHIPAGSAPGTPTERALAQLWESVLEHRPVSREDDFFALGGHSLLSMQLIARIREEMGVAATVRDLISAPVLADLAERIDHTPPTPPSAATPVTPPGSAPAAPPAPSPTSAAPPARAPAHASAPATTPAPAETSASASACVSRLPLSPEQHLRLAREQWRREQGLGPGTHNVSLACTVEGPLHLDRLEQALTDVVGRHEALRATFHRDGTGAVYQEIAAVSPIRIRRETVSPDQEMPSPAVVSAANEPFDLGSGLLLRAVHWARGNGAGVLLLVCDHSVTDLVSIAVLVDDLQRAYAARLTGEAVPWDGPDPGYRAFLVEEAAWLGSPEADQVLEAWCGHLTGPPPYCSLSGLSRPVWQAPPDPVAGSATVYLPSPVTDGLVAAAVGQGASLAHALLALVAISLSALTGQRRIGAFVPMANREAAGSHRLVAYAAHGLPVHQDITPAEPFTHHLAQAARQTMEVLARQRLALAEIVRRLDPEAFGVPASQPYVMVNFIAADLLNASLAPALDRVRTAPLSVGATEPAAPLIVELLQTPQALTVHIVHDRRFIEDTDAQRLAGLLTRLAASAAAAPQASVADLLATVADLLDR